MGVPEVHWSYWYGGSTCGCTNLGKHKFIGKKFPEEFRDDDDEIASNKDDRRSTKSATIEAAQKAAKRSAMTVTEKTKPTAKASASNTQKATPVVKVIPQPKAPASYAFVAKNATDKGKQKKTDDSDDDMFITKSEKSQKTVGAGPSKSSTGSSESVRVTVELPTKAWIARIWAEANRIQEADLRTPSVILTPLECEIMNGVKVIDPRKFKLPAPEAIAAIIPHSHDAGRARRMFDMVRHVFSGCQFGDRYEMEDWARLLHWMSTNSAKWYRLLRSLCNIEVYQEQMAALETRTVDQLRAISVVTACQQKLKVIDAAVQSGRRLLTKAISTCQSVLAPVLEEEDDDLFLDEDENQDSGKKDGKDRHKSGTSPVESVGDSNRSKTPVTGTGQQPIGSGVEAGDADSVTDDGINSASVEY